MKRIIRLTESDLTRIIRRVIMEQSTNGITTLITFSKEKNKDDSYCTPEEKKWKNMDDRGYCPKGTWKYTMKDDRFDYYDKDGKLIGSDSKITPTQEGYNGTVNNISNLSRWVKDKKTDVNGIWKFSGYNDMYFYDDGEGFIGHVK